MRESTAWKILAEEHDAERTTYACLCDNLRLPEGALTQIAEPLRKKMRSRIELAIGDAWTPAYPYVSIFNPLRNPLRRENREARVLACLMFAEQARDEEVANA